MNWNLFFISICTIVVQPKANYFLYFRKNCMKIKEGDKLPNSEFFYLDKKKDPPKEV